jgi:predicted nucleotidyltransferase component of viral defense system
MVGLQKEGGIMTDWRIAHGKSIADFTGYLNEKSCGYVLKGGTALYLCYRLDRFSEDIDIDGRERTLVELVDGFCAARGYKYRVAKDTATVQRCMLNYGNAGKPLKVEASYRRREIGDDEITRINGIQVYKIETLCAMKANAYVSRDKLRDLYDVAFICNNYYDQLSPQARALLRSAVEYRGVEQFDYITREQSDELIDPDKLAEDFLKMYDRLGLLMDERESRMLSRDSGVEPDDDDGEVGNLSSDA